MCYYTVALTLKPVKPLHSTGLNKFSQTSLVFIKFAFFYLYQN